ncbi:hypothetical protein BDP81DRAFT_15837 [Colletotrichum phormii]|uniref:Uncharacterized protein n=1 Tax=Colletotrichum phormii TaxID=359342 RepID=A0AAJ0A445_9PEZI|nr:uncharacterized protein BDP81DRAFT_15837 [Colletotrichum phormii]KAK1656128.1 hypothetical protein BDP81DRAFT_15837 [Colletotrichum phormii]
MAWNKLDQSRRRLRREQPLGDGRCQSQNSRAEDLMQAVRGERELEKSSKLQAQAPEQKARQTPRLLGIKGWDECMERNGNGYLTLHSPPQGHSVAFGLVGGDGKFGHHLGRLGRVGTEAEIPKRPSGTGGQAMKQVGTQLMIEQFGALGREQADSRQRTERTLRIATLEQNT